MSYRSSDNPVKVASPEDNTGSGVGGLVLDSETSPLGVVGASRNSSDEEGEHVHHCVDLAGDTHVEEHNGSDEHAQESDEEKVPDGVGVVIREGDCGLRCGGSLFGLLLFALECVCSRNHVLNYSRDPEYECVRRHLVNNRMTLAHGIFKTYKEIQAPEQLNRRRIVFTDDTPNKPNMAEKGWARKSPRENC